MTVSIRGFLGPFGLKLGFTLGVGLIDGRFRITFDNLKNVVMLLPGLKVTSINDVYLLDFDTRMLQKKSQIKYKIQYEHLIKLIQCKHKSTFHHYIQNIRTQEHISFMCSV